MITSLPVFSPRNPRRYKHKCPMRSAPAFGILSQPLPGTTQPAYRYRSRHQEADRIVTNWKDDALPTPQACAAAHISPPSLLKLAGRTDARNPSGEMRPGASASGQIDQFLGASVRRWLADEATAFARSGLSAAMANGGGLADWRLRAGLCSLVSPFTEPPSADPRPALQPTTNGTGTRHGRARIAAALYLQRRRSAARLWQHRLRRSVRYRPDHWSTT